ncbi:MAG: hypothetical protein R6V06_03055 [Kiritimatiellia bacterium]
MKNIFMIALACAVTVCLYAEMASVDGSNIVGFSTVDDNGNDTSILAVPYVSCLNNDGDIMLADLISTNGLAGHSTDPTQADQLIVLIDDNGLKYYYYYLDLEDGWTGIETAMKQPDGSEVVVTPTAAASLPVSRGEGFWLKRVETSSNPLYVQGEVSASNPSTSIVDGLNLVGYGSGEAMGLNSVDWTGADGGNGLLQNSDKIIVVEADGSLSYYYYFTNPGTGWEAYPAGSSWVKDDYTQADINIPAGQGFWYLRRDGGSFNFQPDN